MRRFLSFPPSFLGFDMRNAHVADISRYFERIIELSTAMRSDLFEVFIAPGTVAALSSSALYPYAPRLKPALQRASLDEYYSAEDITKVLHGIIQRSSSPLDCFGIADYLFDDDVTVEPLPDFLVHASEMQNIEVDFFCAWALATTVGSVADDLVAIYTVGEVDKITVAGTLLLVEPANLLEIPKPNGTPLSVAISVVDKECSFADTYLAHSIWAEAESPEELYLALTIKAFNLKKSVDPTVRWNEFTVHQLGSTFFRSLRENSASGDSSHSKLTFEVCARVLAGQPKHEVKEFFVNKGRFRAFRTHISKRHQALRLMYWELENSRVELANVGPKNEEEIADYVEEKSINPFA